MRRLYLLFTFFIPAFIFAQDPSNLSFTISGKIIDAETKEPIEYTTIAFTNIDSNEIKFGGITNQRGNFSVDVEKGSYTATVTYISYLTKTLNISNINRNLNVGTIDLIVDTEALNEIQISGKINTLDFKQNKQVYNVGKDLSSNNVSASQILTNIPTVSIESDGDLTIRGQGNVTVLIDGKISSLSKSNVLQSLPASSIEKIEVISNPGASYRASASGIINIILKKGKNEGFNASLTGSGGYKDIYGALTTINYKAEKVNFFTTISYAHSNKNTIVNVENEYFTDGLTRGYLEENTLIKNPSNDFMAIAGAQFDLSNKSSLTATAKFDNIIRKPQSTSYSNFYDDSYYLTQENTGNNNAKYNDEIFEFSLDFKQAFKNEGQELTAYITYSNDKEIFENNFTNSNPIFEDEDYEEENTLKNTEISVKYAHPLNDNSSLAFGYLGTFGKTPYQLTKETIEEKTTYTDNINGVFGEYEIFWDTFYIGVGLRAEFTELITEYTNLNSTQKNNFNDIFPSIYLEYNVKDNKSLSLSYSRSIERPGYLELRPYELKISETMSYIGNINLLPVYINSSNLSYTYYGDKLTFISSLYWNNFNNYMQPISFETNDENSNAPKIITTIENIGSLNMYGVNLTADLQATNWLNFIGNANLYQMDQSGVFEYTNSENETITKDFKGSNFSGDFSLLTKIKIPKVFDIQFNLVNQLKSKAVYSTREANTYINLAINKDFWNNNASLGLSINDVFNSKQVNRTWYETDYTSNRIRSQKYQNIILSFTYRFNQDKQQRSVNFDKKQNKPKI